MPDDIPKRAPHRPRTPVGCVRLDAGGPDVPPDATVIVSGPPRSGTSLAAAALHAAGLWIGDPVDRAVFEDLEFNDLSEPQATPRERLRWALADRATWRLAARGIDVARLRGRIAARDARFPRWGFKRPNIVPLLAGDPSLSLFRNPRLVMVFRDPIGLAERVAIAEGMRYHNALYYTRRYTSANLRAAYRSRVPTLLVSYEKANADRERFLDALFAFCGLAVPREAYGPILEQLTSAGAEYLRLAAAPNRGYIDGYVGGVLVGWCRMPGIAEPQAIDIYADEVKVASVIADGFSMDLKVAGFGDGRHRFAVPLEHLGLADSCRIRAVMPGANIEIEKSGLTLGALRTLGGAGP